MNNEIFEGMLTDYALGEVHNPETKALLEALLERDASLRDLLAEIRETTELVVLAGPQSLVVEEEFRSQHRVRRVIAMRVAAMALAAALMAMAIVWWWPGSSNTSGDSELVENRGAEPSTGSAASDSAERGVAAPNRPAPWLMTAVENQTKRSTRRGAGVRWTLADASRLERR
jgi:hypothetical protein